MNKHCPYTKEVEQMNDEDYYETRIKALTDQIRSLNEELIKMRVHLINLTSSEDE